MGNPSPRRATRPAAGRAIPVGEIRGPSRRVTSGNGVRKETPAGAATEPRRIDPDQAEESVSQKKLRLDDLQVESFSVLPETAARWRGTSCCR
jgi:hypothetical protein